MFLCHQSVCVWLCPCISPYVLDVFLRYLWCALMDFPPNFCQHSSASWDEDEQFRFRAQKVKSQNMKNTVFWVRF